MNSIGPNYFNSLPHELAIKVFGYLDSTDLASCALVSKEWNRAAGSDDLWRSSYRAFFPKDAYVKENYKVALKEKLNTSNVLQALLRERVTDFFKQLTWQTTTVGSWQCAFPFHPPCAVIVRSRYELANGVLASAHPSLRSPLSVDASAPLQKKLICPKREMQGHRTSEYAQHTSGNIFSRSIELFLRLPLNFQHTLEVTEQIEGLQRIRWGELESEDNERGSAEVLFLGQQQGHVEAGWDRLLPPIDKRT